MFDVGRLDRVYPVKAHPLIYYVRAPECHTTPDLIKDIQRLSGAVIEL